MPSLSLISVTQIRCIDLYMDEKVNKRSFADHRPVDALLKEMEDEYTARFGKAASCSVSLSFLTAFPSAEKGDHKKAVDKLRGQFSTKTVSGGALLEGSG